MNKKDKESYLLLLILLKKALLQRNDTNVTLVELTEYLNNFYFLDDTVTVKKLSNFLFENEKEIVDYLWTQAIINPK